VPFTSGWLEGKVIVADRGPLADANVVPGHAPGKAFWTRERGVVDSTATPVFAWVLRGYFVSVARMGGDVVDVKIDPDYSFECVGFRVFVSDLIKTKGGNTVLR